LDRHAEAEVDENVMQGLEAALRDLETNEGKRDLSSSETSVTMLHFTCAKNEKKFHRRVLAVRKVMGGYMEKEERRESGAPLGGDTQQRMKDALSSMPRRTSAWVMLKLYKIARTYDKAKKNNCTWVEPGVTSRYKERILSESEKITNMNSKVNPCAENATTALEADDGPDALASALSMMVEGAEGDTCDVTVPESDGTNDGEDELESGDESDVDVDSMANLGLLASEGDSGFGGASPSSLANKSDMSPSLLATSQSLARESSALSSGRSGFVEILGVLAIAVLTFLLAALVCIVALTIASLILGLIWCLIRSGIYWIVNKFTETKKYGTKRCLHKLWKKVGFWHTIKEDVRFTTFSPSQDKHVDKHVTRHRRVTPGAQTVFKWTCVAAAIGVAAYR
jgi:hypothetical protein